jgi:ribosomal protein S18 acetylase RimI-like enzyme
MTRALRALSLADLEQLPSSCSHCVFWESPTEQERRCGSVCDRDVHAAWFHSVAEEWGSPGRIALEDGEVLGFIKYAPARFFPQARMFPSAPSDPDTALITCMHISVDARHHGLGKLLLTAALRDLVERGERRVEAIGIRQSDLPLELRPALGVEFLERHGFQVVGRDPVYPLMRLELRSLASITENLEAVLETLRFPRRAPAPRGASPASWIKGGGA